MIRQARPRIAINLARVRGLELARALRDQRVPLADEHRALLADVDDDLAALAEGVGDRPDVAHGHRRVARSVAHTEEQRAAIVVDGPRRDLAGELVGAAGLGPVGELARGLGLGRGAERRVRQRAGQEHRRPERHHQADLALPGRIHAVRSVLRARAEIRPVRSKPPASRCVYRLCACVYAETSAARTPPFDGAAMLVRAWSGPTTSPSPSARSTGIAGRAGRKTWPCTPASAGTSSTLRSRPRSLARTAGRARPGSSPWRARTGRRSARSSRPGEARRRTGRCRAS